MDHVYLKTTCNRLFSSDTTYRLTPTEIETMVKLRMSNRAYFSGKRNASMRGWRAILKHMGLHTKMTFNQAAKKWDNMRKKYKELKYPPEGVQVLPHAWMYFKLMDNAMHGLLDNSAAIIDLLPNNGDDDMDFLPRHNKRKRGPNATGAAATPQLSLGGAGASEIEVSLHNSGEEEEEEEEEKEEEEEEGDEARGYREAKSQVERVELQFAMDSERASMESERVSMEGERALMERERQLMAKESLGLQRERAALEREEAALERDRATLERERTTIEREKALMERERTMLERDRTELSRERLAMERGRGRPARCTAARDGEIKNNNNDNDNSSRVEADGEVVEESGENGGARDPETLQRRERFLALFEKLVENF
ncbi:unnamed protein product [Lota lota]